jgi:hypothetical protein
VAAEPPRVKKAPGRPWRKGQSGNPSGLPAIKPKAQRVAEMRAWIIRRGPELVRRMLTIARNPDHPKHFEALRELLDRGWGKPFAMQAIAVSHTVTGDRPDVSSMTSGEIRRELEELEREAARRRGLPALPAAESESVLPPAVPDAVIPPVGPDDE